MNKKDITEIKIADSDIVKVIPTQNNIDIRYTVKSDSQKETVKRLTKDTYLDPDTNLVKQYNHKEKRMENESTFYRTKRELTWLILNSFSGTENELFVTLTYSSPMDNYSELNKDYRNFVRRLTNHFKDSVTFEYIVVREPHLSGSWHLHVLIKFTQSDKKATLPSSIHSWSELITKKWQKGHVHVSYLEEVNQLAVYLTNHLMNIFVDENGEEVETFSSLMSVKAVAKNRRLHFYPSNIKIYSYSKGIKKPEKLFMTYKDCMQRYSYDYEKNWDNSILLYNEQFAFMQRQIQLTRKK